MVTKKIKPKKRVFLLMVEGKSDEKALKPIISEMINEQVLFKAVGCDLSSNDSKGYKEFKLVELINIELKKFLFENRGITEDDIEKIVVISDTDGCYIPDEAVYFSDKAEDHRYEDDGIYTQDVEGIIKRNKFKSKKLEPVIKGEKCGDIPVEIYYFSCNLDHVLHNQRNMNKAQKIGSAEDFADLYDGEEEKFVEFVDEFGVEKKFSDSWKFIKKNLNSLMRYSNLNVFFFDNYQYFTDDAKEVIDKCKKEGNK